MAAFDLRTVSFTIQHGSETSKGVFHVLRLLCMATPLSTIYSSTDFHAFNTRVSQSTGPLSTAIQHSSFCPASVLYQITLTDGLSLSARLQVRLQAREAKCNTLAGWTTSAISSRRFHSSFMRRIPLLLEVRLLHLLSSVQASLADHAQFVFCSHRQTSIRSH